MSKPQARRARQWAETNQLFFGTQMNTFKQYTHSIFEGGILALETAKHYHNLHESLADDIVDDAGRIVLCEGFPHIYSEADNIDVISDVNNRLWVYPRLAERTYRFLREPVPPFYQEDFLVKQDIADLRWDTTCLAFDLDYGDVSMRPYNVPDLTKEIHVIQQLMRDRGAEEVEVECLVCIAEQDKQLGIHLYFHQSVYFPEECMQLAELTRHALQDKRPVPHCGKRSWSEIIDVSIYNKTLRMPFLQKAKVCELHQKRSVKTSKNCDCYPTGKVYRDRRYWPLGLIKFKAQLTERWMQSIRVHILKFEQKNDTVSTEFAKFSFAHYLNKAVNDPEMLKRFGPAAVYQTKDATDGIEFGLTRESLKEVVRVVLTMASLRCRKSMREHTVFHIHKNDPVPPYPKPWQHFFLSIYKQTEKCMAMDNTNKRFGCAITRAEYEEAKAQKRLHDHTVYFLKPQLMAFTNPLGTDFSSRHDEVYHRQKVAEAKLNSAELKLRKTLPHLMQETNRDYEVSYLEKMAGINFTQKLVKGEWSETLANDPYGRCLQLQMFLRERMETQAYKELQIRKLILSAHGNCLVMVQGPGQHYCRIANRIHRKAPIYFVVDRRTSTVRQHCFHSGCNTDPNKERCFGVKLDTDLQALFAPKELIGMEAKTDTKKVPFPIKLSTPTRTLSPEQKLQAQTILEKYPMYNSVLKPVPKRTKASKVAAADRKAEQALISMTKGSPKKDENSDSREKTVIEENGGDQDQEKDKDGKKAKAKKPKIVHRRVDIENVANTGMAIANDEVEHDSAVLLDPDLASSLLPDESLDFKDSQGNKSEKEIDGEFEFDDEGNLVFKPKPAKREESQREKNDKDDLIELVKMDDTF